MRAQNSQLSRAALAAGALQFFEGATDLVGIVEAEPPHRLLYLNPVAQKFLAVPAGEALGLPLAEAFTRVSSSPLLELATRAAAGEAQRERALTTRPGSVWNLDAIPTAGAILLVGRPLDAPTVSRQRLEILLASTDSIWLNADPGSLAQAIVDTAAQLIPGIACSLSILRSAGADALEIVAGNEEWLCVGTSVPLAGSLSGQAIASREPVEGSAATADRDHREVLLRAGVAVMRVVPLLPSEPLPDGRVALGVLSFMRADDRPFDVDERRLIDEFGKRASVALDRSEHVQRERRRADRMRAVLDTALALSASLSPESVIDELLQRVVTRLGADRATLSTLGEDVVTIEATFSPSGESATWIGRSYGIDYIERQPLVREAIASKRPVAGGRLEVSSAAPEFRESLVGATHTASVPLVSDGVVGGLLVVSRHRDEEFTADDLATLNLIGHAAMLALKNARLHVEAVTAREQAERLAESLRVGVETSLDLGRELELKEVVDRVVQRAMEVAGADHCVLLAIEGSEAVVTRSLDQPGGRPVAVAGERVQIAAEPLVEAAVRTGIAQQGLRSELGQLGRRHRDEIRRLERFACVPLRYGGTPAGVLNLSRYRPEPFTEQQLQALTLIGQVAALAMRNARLFEELREASAGKTEFLNLAAHELRTPISVLRGYLSLLVEGSLGPVPAAWTEPLAVLVQKATNLHDITEELLVAARVQAGSFGAQPREFDLVAEVEAAVNASRLAAELAGGTVELSSSPGPIQLVADPLQVRRVVDNLLANAVTYSSPPARVAVAVRSTGRRVVVGVRDQGRGIPIEKQDLIFDQFVRVEDPDSEIRPGTGLGLYVARGLARANGGDVRLVRSEVGRGSEFELELPLPRRRAPRGHG